MLAMLVKFGLVGLSGFGVNLAIYNFLLWFAYFDQHYLVANMLAFLFAVTNNFYWNYRWTFKGYAASRSLMHKYTNFFAIAALNFGVNTWMLHEFVAVWQMNKRIASIVAIIVVSIINFLGNYLITFRVTAERS